MKKIELQEVSLAPLAYEEIMNIEGGGLLSALEEVAYTIGYAVGVAYGVYTSTVAYAKTHKS